MKLDDLVAHLERQGWKYRLLESEAGGTVVVLERGGRVAGVFPERSGDNLLWVSPDLEDRAVAERKYDQECHWNFGGERVWFGPELEYHYPDLAAQPDVYVVQQPMDPGQYALLPQVAEGSAGWRQEGTVRANRTGAEVAFALSKSCRLIADPLRHAGLAGAEADYAFAGYETDAGLAAQTSEGGDAPIAIWTLLQVPAGGTAIVPTFGRGEAVDFFAPTGPSHLSVDDSEIRFNIDAKESHKISIRSHHSAGRIGYFRPAGDGRFDLLVRSFRVDPSADYRDAPVFEPDARGHCVQLYNDDGGFGAFGELEYHTPARLCGSGAGAAEVRDIAQTWCYRGSLDAIREVGLRLLGTRL